MSLGLGDLTTRAHDRISDGDLDGARQLLAAALADADPSPAHATAELATAATLLAKVLVAQGEAQAARGWAAFAYAARTRLHGPHDPQTTDAAVTLAAVLHRVGNHTRAARLYHAVILDLSAQDGPEAQRVLAAHADLAVVEYARGECATARTRLEDAWELHREVHGDGHPAGIRMLARLGDMERDCGRLAEAHRHLALAQELCRTHLPPDHPLVGQVAALARAAADPDHVCAAEDGVRIAAASGPHPPRTPTPPTAPSAPDRGPPPFGPPESAAAADRGRSEPTPPGGTSTVPHQRAAEPTPTGGTAPVPHQRAAELPPRPAWEPPQEGTYYREPPRIYTPGGVIERRPASRTRLPEPVVPESLPVAYVPSRAPRRALPLVLIGLVVVVLGAAAVIAGFDPFDGASAPRTTPTASRQAPATTAPARTTAAPPTTTAPPAPPGTPPGAVTLVDGGDLVTLRWSYPRGAKGPVVVSGGRKGQPAQAFQDLPAGSTSYVVYGLDRGSDYCFVVGVVYSRQTVGRAAPVCTRR
ncbi:MAG TPA: tetratricopeptide repeat protein [Asanoa sp.]